ncbi:hypothetical protein HKCCE4037_12760 [Rhodobacterales bacterium HKCCE4037]|nr:hypothetical protein [Rhodobacterales bacterium HKCCE4037]
MNTTSPLSLRGVLGAASLGLLLSAGTAMSQVIDLEGETVTIVHNAAPGGSTGLSSQVLADVWAQTMEGNPTIVVQSVEGGALTRGIQQVMNSRPDGLTIGYVAWQGTTRILDPEELQIPFQDAGIIGGIGGAAFFTHVDAEVAADGDAFANLESLRFGGFSPRSAPSMQMAGVLDLLGVDWSFVSGMGGDGPLRAAMERGEIEAYPATVSIYLQDLRDGPIAAGETTGIYHIGRIDEDGAEQPIEAFGGAFPTVTEYLAAQLGETPSGPIWDMIMFHSEASAPVNWLVMAPPGTSEEHLAMLRESFAEAVQSPEYLEAATNVFGGEPNIVLYEQMLDIVNTVQNTPEELRETMRAYIAEMEG